MFNRTPYNRSTYNRKSTFTFEWLATAYAEAGYTATLLLKRHFDGTVEASTTAGGIFVRVLLPSAVAEAVSAAAGVFIRTKFFTAETEAISAASGYGVSTYGSVTMVIEGVNMVAGDELVIDTEHMTVTLNGENIVDKITDASAFFKLKAGENEITVEGGSTADIKVLWKDRWL